MEAGRFPTRAVKRVNRCQQPLNRYYWWVNGMNFFFSNEARADTRNISFKNSLRWSIYIIKSVYEIQLSCYDPPPLDATQQFPSGWTFILFSEVNMTFGLSNSVIQCFGELVLIYTFIITNHSLSTTLKGGGGGGGGGRVVKDSCCVIIKFVYSRKGSIVIQWSSPPSLAVNFL